MTFQEKFNELHKDFAEKSDKHLKADNDLSQIVGFGDAQEMTNFLRTKQEWQIAANDYHNFLAYFQKSGKQPNDQLG